MKLLFAILSLLFVPLTMVRSVANESALGQTYCAYWQHWENRNWWLDGKVDGQFFSVNIPQSGAMVTDPTHQRIYLLDRSGAITAYSRDLKSRSIIAKIPIHKSRAILGNNDMAWDPKGNRIVVMDFEFDLLYSVDVSTRKVAVLLNRGQIEKCIGKKISSDTTYWTGMVVTPKGDIALSIPSERDLGAVDKYPETYLISVAQKTGKRMGYGAPVVALSDGRLGVISSGYGGWSFSVIDGNGKALWERDEVRTACVDGERLYTFEVDEDAERLKVAVWSASDFKWLGEIDVDQARRVMPHEALVFSSQ